jgi:hypothetical protein
MSMPLFNMDDVDRILQSEDVPDTPKKVLPKQEPFTPKTEYLGNECIGNWRCFDCQMRLNCTDSVVQNTKIRTREWYHSVCRSFQVIDHFSHLYADAVQFFKDCETYPNTDRSIRVTMKIHEARLKFFGSYRVYEVVGTVKVAADQGRRITVIQWRPNYSLLRETTIQCTLSYKKPKYKKQTTVFTIASITELIDDPHHPREALPEVQPEPEEEKQPPKRYEQIEEERRLY